MSEAAKEHSNPWNSLLILLTEESVPAPGPDISLFLYRIQQRCLRILQEREDLDLQTRRYAEAYCMSLEAVMNVWTMQQTVAIEELKNLLKGD